MNKHQKYLFILLVVCCSLAIMRRLFTEAYEEGEMIGDVKDAPGAVTAENPTNTQELTDEEMEVIQKEDEITKERLKIAERAEPQKQDCTGTYEGATCPEFCGYEGGEINNKWIAELQPMHGGKECPKDQVLKCPATDPCPVDCEGYHEEHPFCPGYCGYEGGSVSRKWVTTTPPQHGGEACPGDLDTNCPTTDTCISVQSVMTY
jgi:hypothetical protein